MEKELSSMESEDKIFKESDPKSLDHNIVPPIDKVVGRDEEINKIADNIKRHNDILIDGASGLGKTMTVKLTVRIMKEKYDYQCTHIEIDNLENEREALQEIAIETGATDYEGYQLERYYKEIRQEIKENDLDVVLAIDELETLFNNKKSRKDHGNKLIKKLSDKINTSLKEDPDTTGSLTIVGTTNDTRLMEEFDDVVEKRFGSETFTFSRYTEENLKEILRRRAKDAFKPKSLRKNDNGDLPVIVHIAKLAKKNTPGGDARYAIRLLAKAAELAETDNADYIQNDYVKEAKNVIERNNFISALRNVNKSCMLVYYSALELYQEDKKKIRTSDVYDKYEEVCRSIEESRISSQLVSNYISELDTIGVLESHTVSKGRKGRYRKVDFTISEEQIEEVQKFIEKKINEENRRNGDVDDDQLLLNYSE